MEMEKEVELLVKAFDVISNDLNQEISWFENTLPDMENCFVFIQKHTKSASDLLKYYRIHWLEIEILLETDEYVERLMWITRAAFIFSLSSVEYCLKSLIKKSRKGPLVEWKSKMQERDHWIYLRGIMNESKGKALIDESQHVSWTGMIELRNVIMHNNAIVDEDTTFKIGGITIQTKAGEMVSYHAFFRPMIIKVLVSMTRTWIEAYLKSHTV